MSTGNERDLSRAKKVITATMRLKMAKLLFNEPVDPAALGLPNYFDVVKEPMDLGTILGKLSAGEQQDWTKCEYQTAEAVYRDVSLVWHNCVLYNSREIDKPTREAALNVKAIFEQNWKEAGLVSKKPAELPAKTTECLPESNVQSIGTTPGAMLSLSSLSSITVGLSSNPSYFPQGSFKMVDKSCTESALLLQRVCLFLCVYWTGTRFCRSPQANLLIWHRLGQVR